MSPKRALRPSPWIRHNVPGCGATFAVSRLLFRHGVLRISPLYCHNCHTRLNQGDIQPVNEEATREMVFYGLIPDPAKVPAPVEEFAAVDF
jgi:hypothetical protein